MKKGKCLLTIIIVFILQSTVIPLLFNGTTQPNLIGLAVILTALCHGQRIGIIAALMGGIGQDVVIGNFFGIHLLPYLIIALVCSKIGRSIERNQYVLILLLALGATELTLVLTCMVLWFSGQFIDSVVYLTYYTVPMLLYHVILALPVHFIISRLRREDTFSYGFMTYR